MPISKNGTPLKQIISEQVYANCVYCMAESTAKMTKLHCERPELIWIDKIAQMRVVFPEYFDTFTQQEKVKLKLSPTVRGIFETKEIDGNWEMPVEHEYKTYDGISTDTYHIKLDDYPWGKYLNTNPAVKASYTSDKVEFFKAFYTEFGNYISTTTSKDDNFWESVTENTSVSDIITQIEKEALFQLQQAPLDKKEIAIKKIVEATSFFSTNTDYFIKLLASFKEEQKEYVLSYIEENIGYQKIYENFYNQGNWYTPDGKDNLTAVLMLISNMITSSGHYTVDENKEVLFLNDINKIPELEADMFCFRNLNWDFTSKNNLNIGDAYTSVPYNQMVSVRIAGSLKVGNISFPKGSIIQIPAIQAALMSHANTVNVGGKTAWLAFDLGTLVIGVGEAKILLSSGNYIRKALVVSDIIGSSAGIVVQSLNEDAISPELRGKIQIVSFLMTLPNLAKQIPQVNRAVKDLDDVINTGLNVKGVRLTQKELDELRSIRDELKAKAGTVIDRSGQAKTLIINTFGRATEFARDERTINKVAEFLNSSNKNALDAIGGETGLQEIIRANVRAGCGACGTSATKFLKNMDEYLDDVLEFSSKYGNRNINGFEDVIKELKKVNTGGSPNYAMEGAAFMIDKIRKTPEITPSMISRFDGRFEGEIGDICANCRLDIELTNGTKYEYKSYSESSINRISTSESFRKQHLSYLAETEDISKLNYIFDAKKFNRIDDIKKQFQKLYQNNVDDVFDIVWNNTKLRNRLFEANIGGAEAKLDFADYVKNMDDKLFKFIKSE
jgi:hypothetical protein